MSTAEQHFIASDDSGIAAYSEFRAQLAQLNAENKALVFDYADPQGNKDARSHLHKLRRTKGAVDAARKAEKAASLEYGRRVDAEAKEIIGQIEDMIEVHERPIREIEEREATRKQDILNRLGVLCGYLDLTADAPSGQLRAHLEVLEEIPVDETFAESMAAATTHKKDAVAHLHAIIAVAEKREAEAAELEQLRREAAVRAQAEREERIAAEAAAEATAAAAAAAERAQKAADQAIQRAESDARAAEERAAKIAQETEERLKREAGKRAAEERAAVEKREADKKHRAAVNNAAVAALVEIAALSEDDATLAVEAIAKRLIPAVVINY